MLSVTLKFPNKVPKLEDERITEKYKKYPTAHVKLSPNLYEALYLHFIALFSTYFNQISFFLCNTRY